MKEGVQRTKNEEFQLPVPEKTVKSVDYNNILVCSLPKFSSK